MELRLLLGGTDPDSRPLQVNSKTGCAVVHCFWKFPVGESAHNDVTVMLQAAVGDD